MPPPSVSRVNTAIINTVELMLPETIGGRSSLCNETVDGRIAGQIQRALQAYLLGAQRGPALHSNAENSRHATFARQAVPVYHIWFTTESWQGAQVDGRHARSTVIPGYRFPPVTTKNCQAMSKEPQTIDTGTQGHACRADTSRRRLQPVATPPSPPLQNPPQSGRPLPTATSTC